MVLLMSKTNKIQPKLLEVRKVLILVRVCLEGYTRGHWGGGNVLCLDPCVGYMGVFHCEYVSS